MQLRTIAALGQTQVGHARKPIPLNAPMPPTSSASPTANVARGQRAAMQTIARRVDNRATHMSPVHSIARRPARITGPVANDRAAGVRRDARASDTA